MFKRKIVIVCLTAVLLAGVCLPAYASGYSLPEGTTVNAGAAILVNCGSSAERDVVLYEKEADTVHAPGSMIRYMVVAYTLHRLDETGVDADTATGSYTEEMFNRHVAGTGVPTANMAFGDVWTVRDLLAASFLQSASDAVTALAYAIDGGVEPFVKGMNELAKEIGCTYTHFANVTGLDSLSQYTTARDVYRIVRYAQTFSTFEAIASTRQYTTKPVSGTPRTLVSVNSMQQSSSPFYYSPLVFSRTGLSDHEGRTCASVARDSGYEYLAVVMACPETNTAGATGLHYQDTKTLFRWAFNHFTYTTLLKPSEILASMKVRLSWSTDHVNLVPAQEFSTVVDNRLNLDQVIKKVTMNEKQVDAPVEKGTVLGKVELIVNVDQKIGEVDLVASESIQRNWLLYAFSGFASVFSSVWFWLCLGLVLVLLIGYVVLNIVYNRRRRRDRLGRVRPKQ